MKTPRFAVIGNPIAHSLSPQVHAEFARGCGIDLEYTRLFAPEDGFSSVAGRFFDSGGCGMNVTAPFKGDAAAWVDQLDDNAALTESVNTITVLEGGRTRGHSTDGAGLLADLKTQWGVATTELRILIVGAGGATREIVPSLLAEQPKRLVVANRTLARAQALVERFAQLGKGQLEACSFDRGETEFDLVINATSGEARSAPRNFSDSLKGALCYDLSYDLHGDAAFCAKAKRCGARDARDGLGMLVWQAAFSFEIWHGVMPDAEAALAALRHS